MSWAGGSIRCVPRPRRQTTAVALGLFWPVAGLLLFSGLMLFDSSSHAQQRYWPRAEILSAIRFVESSHHPTPPDGDQGRAIGPFQIHLPYWMDAIAQDPGIGGDYQDCRQLAYARRIVAAYMERYAPVAWQKGDAETIARIHNGGPNGAKIQATLGYWKLVRRRLTR